MLLAVCIEVKERYTGQNGITNSRLHLQIEEFALFFMDAWYSVEVEDKESLSDCDVKLFKLFLWESSLTCLF